jgi:predicted dehydrogenase
MSIDILWSLAGVAATAAIYVAFVIARRWLGKWGGTAALKSVARAWWHGPSVDFHIETQWTEGRLRLDTLLALLRKLEASLEQEGEKLRHLDPSASPNESENLAKVGSTLRRFAFGQHLREECRALVSLLQFCARDITEFQGRDMTRKLNVLAEIQAAIEAAERV